MTPTGQPLEISSWTSAAAAPLVERYKILMRASKACCTEGIIHKLHTIKAKDKNIYEFLKDDANRFAVGERCLVLTNDDIAKTYSNGVNGEMVRDERGDRSADLAPLKQDRSRDGQDQLETERDGATVEHADCPSPGDELGRGLLAENLLAEALPLSPNPRHGRKAPSGASARTTWTSAALWPLHRRCPSSRRR